MRGKSISIELSNDLHRQLKEMAQKRGRTIASLIREMITKELENFQKL